MTYSHMQTIIRSINIERRNSCSCAKLNNTTSIVKGHCTNTRVESTLDIIQNQCIGGSNDSNRKNRVRSVSKSKSANSNSITNRKVFTTVCYINSRNLSVVYSNICDHSRTRTSQSDHRNIGIGQRSRRRCISNTRICNSKGFSTNTSNTCSVN